MKERNINIPLLGISVMVFVSLAIYLAADADRAGRVINAAFSFSTNTLGTAALIFGVFAFGFCMFIMFKYGKIKLGEGNAQHSYPSYLAMLIAAALGASFVNMSFVEWSWYYSGPAMGMESMSKQAAEWAVAYSFFHWGILSWATYGLAAIPICYAYHIKKLNALRFSAVVEYMIGDKPYAKPIGKIVDFLFVISLLGGVVVTLGVGIPILSSGLGRIFGFTPSFTSNVIVTIAIACLFSLSSYVGLEKGMKKISGATVYLGIFGIVMVLLFGPTQFIIKNTVNSLGIMIHNYVHMSFWTDPVTNGGFPEAWTVYYIIWGVAYATLNALFVAKISRGRTVAEMIAGVVFGGSIGCYLFFGINSSYALDLQLKGAFDVVKSMTEVGQAETIMGILGTMPFGFIGLIVFMIVAILFLATTMDAAAFTLSATSTKYLTSEENTSPFLRLFWCGVMAACPLAMTFIDAPFSYLQTLSIVLALPFSIVLLYMAYKCMAWFKADTSLQNAKESEMLLRMVETNPEIFAKIVIPHK